MLGTLWPSCSRREPVFQQAVVFRLLFMPGKARLLFGFAYHRAHIDRIHAMCALASKYSQVGVYMTPVTIGHVKVIYNAA
jgi:hypothetical protein